MPARMSGNNNTIANGENKAKPQTNDTVYRQQLLLVTKYSIVMALIKYAQKPYDSWISHTITHTNTTTLTQTYKLSWFSVHSIYPTIKSFNSVFVMLTNSRSLECHMMWCAQSARLINVCYAPTHRHTLTPWGWGYGVHHHSKWIIRRAIITLNKFSLKIVAVRDVRARFRSSTGNAIPKHNSHRHTKRHKASEPFVCQGSAGAVPRLFARRRRGGGGTVLSPGSGYDCAVVHTECVHMILQPLKIKWNWKTNARHTHTPPVGSTGRMEWIKKAVCLHEHLLHGNFFSAPSPYFFPFVGISFICLSFLVRFLPFSMLCKGFFFVHCVSFGEFISRQNTWVYSRWWTSE